MAILDNPVGFDRYYKEEYPWCDSWCSSEIEPLGYSRTPNYEVPSNTFDHWISEVEEQIINFVQDTADEACVKSYQFCDISGIIEYDNVTSEQVIKIHFFM